MTVRPRSATAPLATLTLTLLAGGCAAGTSSLLPPGTTPDVVVNFAAGCPVGATVAGPRQCKGDPKQESCLLVQKGDWVTFASSPPGKEFTLYFDPFKKGGITAPKGEAKEKIDPAAPAKTYSYNIVAPGCPIIDPRIIVQ